MSDEFNEDVPSDFGDLAVVEDGGLAQVDAPLGEVADQLSERARIFAQSVRDLQTREQDQKMELARTLYEIKAGALYNYIINPVTQEPYTCWKDYVEEEVGGGQRSADYYASVWGYFSKYGEDFLAQMMTVKYHKLKELVNLVTPDNGQGWIDLANNPAITTAEFRHEVSEAKKKLKQGEAGDALPVTPRDAKNDALKSFTVRCTQTQFDRIQHAMALAQDYEGTDLKPEMLEAVCEHYIEQREGAGAKGDEVPLALKLEQLSRDHGLRLIAFMPDSGSVIYGVENIDILAAKAIEAAGEGEA